MCVPCFVAWKWDNGVVEEEGNGGIYRNIWGMNKYIAQVNRDRYLPVLMKGEEEGFSLTSHDNDFSNLPLN